MRGVKRKNEGTWKKYAVFLFLLLVFGVLINSTRKVYNKKVEAENALSRMQQEIGDLEERKEILEENIKRVETDEGLEFEIRKKFNVARVGEGVAIIVEEESTTTTPNPSPSLWQKFKNFLSGIFR